jgi:hypothetical protein
VSGWLFKNKSITTHGNMNVKSHNTDCEARLDVVKRYLISVHDGKINPTLILIINEEWFQLSRYVDPQNNRFRELIQKMPLKDVRVGVRCVTNSIL